MYGKIVYNLETNLPTLESPKNQILNNTLLNYEMGLRMVITLYVRNVYASYLKFILNIVPTPKYMYLRRAFAYRSKVNFSGPLVSSL